MAETGIKWMCTGCGHEHIGEDAPEECPECNSWNDFYQSPD